MRLSVAMCTCNGSRFLLPQLQSLLRQQRQPDELIVCDDASTDDTPAIVRQFADSCPFPVRLVCNGQQLGVTRNFAQAIAQCTGEIIFLADQDDIWLEGKLQRIEAVFAQCPDTGAVFCNGQVVDASLSPLGYSLWESFWFTPQEQRRVRAGQTLQVLLKHNVAAGTTLAFRSVYLPLLLPLVEINSFHDAWITMLIAAVADVAIVPDLLMQYRLHSANQVGHRRFTFREQLAQARQQVDMKAFHYAMELHQAAQERLRLWAQAGHPLRPEALPLLEAKIRHSQVRDAMNGRWLQRLPAIAREALAGRYGRYAYGWKSVAQDLFLR